MHGEGALLFRADERVGLRSAACIGARENDCIYEYTIVYTKEHDAANNASS